MIPLYIFDLDGTIAHGGEFIVTETIQKTGNKMNKLVNGIDKRIALRRAKVRCNSAAEAISKMAASCETLSESMKKLSRFCQPLRYVKK